MSLSNVFKKWITAYKADFATRWKHFVRANYSSPEEVSMAFGVRYQTAWNWWHGLNRPYGDIVGLGYTMHPESARALLSPEEGNPTCPLLPTSPAASFRL